MYLDDKTKELVLNLTQVIADQKKELDQSEVNVKMYRDWYNDSKKREEILEKRLKELETQTPIAKDIMGSNGTNNVKL